MFLFAKPNDDFGCSLVYASHQGDLVCPLIVIRLVDPMTSIHKNTLSFLLRCRLVARIKLGETVSELCGAGTFENPSLPSL
jgi:hypothetical protein